MATSDEESDFSGDELLENLNNFDLVNVNGRQRQQLMREWHDIMGDSSDSEPDWDGYEPEETYEAPTYDENDWVKVRTPRNVVDFVERVGPTRVFDTSATALDYFQLFYTDELFEKIVNFTNLNAEMKRRNGDKGVWTPVTLQEMKAYYGLLILMEIMQFERDELYWTESTKNWLIGSKFAEVMSRDRFIQIKRYLHFRDVTAGVNERDKLNKIRFLLDHFRQAFQREYLPHREISVDEAMVPFKGRLGIKQYMKDKPVKFGIKLWVATDAVSAYCLNYEVYVGKHADIVNNVFGLSSRVVIELTKFLELKGHVIFTDNFYTSPLLADYLLSRNTYLCGTIRNNRKGYPKQLVVKKSDEKKIERGDSDWLMNGDLLATWWKDNRVVYYLSTFHDPEDDQLVATRKNKDGTEAHLKSTPTQAAYAQYMGGVDRLDQMTRINKAKKCMRWYRKVEVKLRECAAYNAYIIEGNFLNHHPANHRKRDFMSFKLELAHSLIGDFRNVSRRSFKRPRSDANNDARLDGNGHLPIAAGGKDRLCVVCNRKHRNYMTSHPGCTVKDNPYKRSKTTMACEKCDVPLCCNAHSTCYRDFHSKVYYWQ